MEIKKLKTAREAAIALLSPYVKRGDNMEQFKHGYYGYYGDDMRVSIGGYLKSKHYNCNYIIVYQINNVDVNEVFKYSEIVEAVRNSMIQTILF